ncbi:MAG: exoribonuclease II [Pantoea sp. Brub]|nr:exoribonuclease II [Pantoea sp. Brub]
MFHNNPVLMQLKKKLHLANNFVEGIVKSNDKGFGFLEVKTQKNYFIPHSQMKKVMHGDRIIATISNNQDRETAIPEKLIEPFLNRFIGRIQTKDNNLSIIPNYPFVKDRIPCSVLCDLKHECKNGDWFIAEMRCHPLRGDSGFYAELVDLIVKCDDYFAPWLVTLSRYNLERTAPDTISHEMLHENLNRKDLTHLSFITIDNSTTEDMDDALYIKSLNDNALRLTIAIADPTSYIPEGSKLDQLAAQRGFTNYLPGFSIPMLPRNISDNICSLRPNVQRPVLACSVTIINDGSLQDIHFFAAWIKSKAKLAYNDVSDWLENIGNWKPDNCIIEEQIYLLYRLCLLRIKWRKKYALIFKDKLDYRFIISKKGEVLNIIAESRRIANHIVEEAMILANMCAGKILHTYLGFGIYNVHFGFDTANISQAVTFLNTHGMHVDAKKITTLDGFILLKRQLDAQPTQYLNHCLRRFQKFAEISTKPGPHFGLGIENYATWTSPIRKFSDMINHRLLKSIIRGDKKVICPLDNELIIKISERRKLNRIAEKNISDWLYACYLSKFISKNYKFITEIIYVSRNGMKVRLIENGATAFIPASLIHLVRDELICNQENGTLEIKDKIIYRITDIINVNIIKVCIDSRTIFARPIF